MKIFVVAAVFACANCVEIADMISNYAKVSVNSMSEVNRSTTPAPSTIATIATTQRIMNDTDEDEVEEYDDFDDATETAAQQSRQTSFDSGTMLNYLNGVVNLLAMMYQFSGRPVKKQGLHFGKPKSRYEGRGNLAEDVNSIAEDRFQPSTAHKKFKKQSNDFGTVDTFPPYNPYKNNKAETYAGGATSYDSDADQYMIQNPMGMSDSNGSGKPTPDDSMYKMPMKNGMDMDDPVQIQQSYSYEIPQNGGKKVQKPSMMDWQSVIDHPQPEDSHNELYYPWLSKPTKEVDSAMDMPSPMKDEDHPVVDSDDSPVYYPWMSKNRPKKPKPARPPPPPPLPPSMDDDEIPMHDDEDSDHPPWMSHPMGGSKGKNNYPPPPDDHHFPVYWPGDHHDHGFIDDHHEEDHDHDHAVKDEDRESKRPYTYYHLGRKLWYIPLLFSLYFIVYIGALILKSLARHKVQFPEKLWELGQHHHHHDEHSRRGRMLDEVTQRVHDGIDNVRNKFM